jgi:NlpC/P60 family putative phage cell wall peptidase
VAAARRHLVEIEPAQVAAGCVLLFRWRATMPAKHCAVATSPGTMIHAHDGASVVEVALCSWWRRHLAYAFRFPEKP